MTFRLLLLFVFSFAVFAAQANSPIQHIKLDAPRYKLNGLVEYYEDNTKQLRLDEVSQLSEQNWHRLQDPVINLGIKDTVVWVHFFVDPPAAAEQLEEWSLAVGNVQLVELDLFWQNPQGQWINVTPGVEQPAEYSKSPIDARSYNLPYSPGSPNQYYIRADAGTSAIIPLTFQSKTDWQRWDQRNTIYRAIYYGAMLIMFFFFVSLTLGSRSKVYGLHSLYIANILLFNMSIDGFLKQYVLAGSYHPITSTVVLTGLIVITGCAFSREILRSSERVPVIDKLIVITAALAIPSLLLLPVIGTVVLSQIVIILTGIETVLIVCACTKIYLKGHKEIRYFALAWFCYLFFTLNAALVYNGSLPWNPAVPYYVHIGSAIETVLISISLADQLTHFRLEKLKTETSAKERLAFLNSLLTKSNQLKDQFLSTISHELRTPMNGVLGALELLEHEDLPIGAKNFIQTANHSAQDMVRLVDDLLCFSDLISHESTPKEVHFSSDTLQNFVLDKFSDKLCAKNLTLNVTTEDSMPEYLVADREKIKTVVFQLIDNAIKFTEEGSIDVTIGGHNESSGQFSLKISVSDTGIGITEEKLSSLYHAFHQADSSFSRKYGGLGIGLAICRKVVDSLKGEIKVFSTLGKGTRVELILPARSASSTADFPVYTDTTNPAPLLPPSINALVVEDNPVNQQILAGFLKKLDMTIHFASNGLEAAELCEERVFDLIFMDCQMPIMDGYEATKQIRSIRSKNQNTFIIAVTANALESDIENCFSSGMNAFLKKPIKLIDIQNKIAELGIENRQRFSQHQQKRS